MTISTHTPARLGIATLLTGLVLGMFAFLASPAWAICALEGTQPQQVNSNVTSEFGRGDSCTSEVAWVTGRLKHQKIGPDSVLDSETINNVVNSTGNPLSAPCLGAGAVYYTETESSTGAKFFSSTNTACG